MKYFKLFLSVCAMAVAISASAQSKTTAKSKTATTTAKTTTAAPAKKATTTAKPATTTTTAKAVTTTTTTTKTTTAKAAKSSSSKAFSSSGDFDNRLHFMMETKIGSYYGTGGWGENFVLEKEYHKYFAVDFFSIDFGMPFKIGDYKLFSLGLKAGARGFSPRFWGDRARAYTSLALGYDCCVADGGAALDMAADMYGFDDDDLDDYDTGWGASHGFALSWGAGVQFVDRVYVGYALEYSTIFKSTSHFAKIGVRF